MGMIVPATLGCGVEVFSTFSFNSLLEFSEMADWEAALPRRVK